MEQLLGWGASSGLKVKVLVGVMRSLEIGDGVAVVVVEDTLRFYERFLLHCLEIAIRL